MKKIKYSIYILLVSTMFSSCDYDIVSDKDFTEALEQAYFEGQRDYAIDDKRIEWTSDSCWVWIKSPWNNGKQPIYNPSLIRSKSGE